MNRVSPPIITDLKKNEVFVFGSNGLGHHAGGAALTAHNKFGAIHGQSEGLQGQSYGINSMDGIIVLQRQIQRFTDFARQNPEKTFLVTEIGCGIAGHPVEQIAPLFKECIPIHNIHLPKRFWNILKPELCHNTN